MDFEIGLKTLYKIFLGVGSLLGFVSTFLAIRREVQKGPKIFAKATKVVFKNTGLRVATIVDDRQVSKRSATISVRIQFHNGGNELTSITSVKLKILSQTLFPKTTKQLKFVSSQGVERSGLNLREDDIRTITLQQGTALVEIFQFDIEYEEQNETAKTGIINFEFINHSPIQLELIFEK
jgi:hypothetical protein